MITEKDKPYLQRCIDLASEALAKGDQPFGSVLVSRNGDILFEDHNHIAEGDNTQHPEFNIVRWAGQHLSPEERAQATVYTSGEHCPMCAAAHGMAGLGRIVYVSSSQQLNEWLDELGIERTSRVISRPIQAVITDTAVDGPVLEWADTMKDLHRRYYEQKV
ncbi:nucleoside deaminase [Fundicoccus culcitae]|uniref:Nucleoside deaminase n=1 Tax=Fundicoccus culcitae TaxID=2969821 RepID=A0ABY5P495_9LACT|nr:nucleoside deaminase [Fundicoccus culcitae]UUX33374.1 nucleoside deaminase [Fundicoccus culcitae]